MAMMDVTNKFPYNKIVDVEVDGQAMVYIPKLYVKNTAENGLIERHYDRVKLPGYHVHPAFMRAGHEVDGIYIGKYLTKGTATAPTSTSGGDVLKLALADAQKAGQALGTGWHMYNIYEHHLLALLMLIECGSADTQNLIGGSSTANGVTHYGITDIWGSLTENVWIDGIDTRGSNDTTLRVLDNLSNGTMIDTGMQTSSLANGWVVHVAANSGEGFDMKDLFISTAISHTESNGTFGDWQSLSTGGRGVCLDGGVGSGCGAFSLDCFALSSLCAFRLAKYRI